MKAQNQGSSLGGTRLTMVPVEEFDPELRELVAADERTPLELGLLRVHAHRPSHAKAIVGCMPRCGPTACSRTVCSSWSACGSPSSTSAAPAWRSAIRARSPMV